MLDDAAQFVRDFTGWSGTGGLAAVPMSLHGPLGYDGHLDDDDDLELGDFLASGAPNPILALRVKFDRLCIACKEAGVAKPVKMAHVVAIA